MPGIESFGSGWDQSPEARAMKEAMGMIIGTAKSLEPLMDQQKLQRFETMGQFGQEKVRQISDFITNTTESLLNYIVQIEGIEAATRYDEMAAIESMALSSWIAQDVFGKKNPTATEIALEMANAMLAAVLAKEMPEIDILEVAESMKNHMNQCMDLYSKSQTLDFSNTMAGNSTFLVGITAYTLLNKIENPAGMTTQQNAVSAALQHFVSIRKTLAQGLA